MIGIVAADDDVLVRLALFGPIGAHQTNVGIVRLGPARSKEDVVQIARCQLGNFAASAMAGTWVVLKNVL